MNTKELVSEAISWLINNYPYIASPLLRTRIHYTNHNIVAGVTDDYHLYIGKEFKNDLSRTVLAHEAMHILGGSMLRQGNRSTVLWNLATDLEINWMLKEMGFDVSTGLYREDCDGLRAEEIYEKLKEEAGPRVEQLLRDIERLSRTIKNKLKKGEDPSQEIEELKEKYKELFKELGVEGTSAEIHPDMNNLPEKTKETVKQHLLNMMISAEQIGKNIGGIPGSLKRIIDDLTTSRVTWKDLFRECVHNLKNDYSYRRPQKGQLLYADCYCPSLSNGSNSVVVITDTSGSISREELRMYLSEVKEIVEEFPTIFIACDCEVQAVVEDGDIEQILDAVKGGGGTFFQPAMEWIEENVQHPHSVVLMTDGYNDDKELPIPAMTTQVIVLTTGKEPEGITPDVIIKMKEEEVKE